MYLLAIDDLLLSDLGITATSSEALLTDDSQFREWSTRSREGSGGSVFFGNTPQPAIWAFVIKCPTIAAQDAIWAALSGDQSEERRLLAQRLDVANTRVVARAAVREIRQVNEFDFWADFEGQDSVWESESSTETTKTFTSVLDQALPLTVPGNTRTAPTIILIPTAQRTTQTAAVGYRWRRRFTVTNNSDVPWYRLPCRVDLGSTTAHVTATRAQADGDDVRLVADGIEQERTLVTWNTGASYLWFIIQNLQPGDSQTYDILSGNSAAVSPPVLAYPNLPPFTLASSSNASWVYPTTTAGLGAWWLARAQTFAMPDFTVPGAWQLARTFWNPDSRDNVHSASDLTGKAVMQVTRSGNDFPTGWLNNFRDGVALYHPLGISSVTANFQWLNPNGAGLLLILTRDSAAEEWSRLFQHSATTATFTAVAPGAQTPTTPVKHLAMAVWPLNVYEIADGVTTQVISVFWDTTLSVAISTTDLSIVVESTWTEVYELATTLRIGGGGNAVAPYHELLVGNADGIDGAGTPRAIVTLAQGLKIDCDDYSQEVWSQTAGTLVAYVEDMSAHAVAATEGWEE